MSILLRFLAHILILNLSFERSLLFNNNNIFRSIILIKKYYFYKLLEKNFSHLTSIKAKYALGFKFGPIIAKNINYTNRVSSSI
ncbi:MAG: hypothetical protein ACEY3D_07445 [Rickettsia sp.]|uniref:hypothetical protein n=1 Tax=Rickettsia sp. TaxID=789 RepID=UPI00397AD3C2